MLHRSIGRAILSVRCQVLFHRVRHAQRRVWAPDELGEITPDTVPMSLPYSTADVPGIEAAYKSRPEDFVVEELAAYAPSGTGTHAYFVVEKRGITTQEAVRRVA